jgi:hypothetical protein
MTRTTWQEKRGVGVARTQLRARGKWQSRDKRPHLGHKDLAVGNHLADSPSAVRKALHELRRDSVADAEAVDAGARRAPCLTSSRDEVSGVGHLPIGEEHHGAVRGPQESWGGFFDRSRSSGSWRGSTVTRTHAQHRSSQRGGCKRDAQGLVKLSSAKICFEALKQRCRACEVCVVAWNNWGLSEDGDDVASKADDLERGELVASP